MMQFIYNYVADVIEREANSNNVRSDYYDVMSRGQFNNDPMTQLCEVIATIAEAELRKGRVRSAREEEDIIISVAEEIITLHVGYISMDNRRLMNEVDDRLFDDLKAAARGFENVLRNLGGGYGRRDSGRVADVRDVYRNGGYSLQGRTSYRDGRASQSTFGGYGGSSIYDRQPVGVSNRAPQRGFERPAETSVRRPASQGFGAAPAPHPQQRTYVPAPMQEAAPVELPVEPMQSPHDTPEDFWKNGEHWQIAHKSDWKWSWSKKQQHRRWYDPDNEVRFLVKGADGNVREEFVPMTDDLIESAHEIRTLTRPNRRIAQEPEYEESVFVGEDIDAPNMERMRDPELIKAVIKYSFEEFKSKWHYKRDTAAMVGNDSEAVALAAAEATRREEHVTSVEAMVTELVPGDAETKKALATVAAAINEDEDLSALRKRLISLRGNISENVLGRIDKHLTKEVNAAILDQFGIVGLNIDSFVEDFDDLLECNAMKSQGQAYITQFLQRTRLIMAGLVIITDEGEHEEIISCMNVLDEGVESESYEEFRKNVVILFKPTNVVHVKMDSEEFGLVTNEVTVPGRSGTDEIARRLGMILCDLYNSARSRDNAGRVYLTTADYMTFELVPISGARDIIGIKLADI